MENLADRLKKALADKGWNKADLRRAAGLNSPSTLTELISGKRKQSPQLPVIAEALSVSVIWLQHGRGPENSAKADQEPLPKETVVTGIHYRIKAARLKAGLSQEQVGDLFGIHKTAVSLWETDNETKRTLPTVDKLLPFCELTKVTVVWLITGKECFEPQPSECGARPTVKPFKYCPHCGELLASDVTG